MTDYSWLEMMAIFFSRDLEDGDRVASGAHTEITTAAALMAQKTHAPNLKLQLGGGCFLVNVSDVEIYGLPSTSVDYRMVQWAEEYHPHPETFYFFGPPGRREYVENREAFRDSNKYYLADKFFVGGLQVDRHGSVNLIGRRGPNGGFSMRGPGTVGIGDVVSSRETYVFLTAHTPDRLVEQVDFVSAPGWDLLKEHGHLSMGPKYIATPMAVFARGKASGVAELQGIFAGNDVERVHSATGFEFALAPDFAEVPPPTHDELSLLRNHVDKKAVLRL